MTLETFGWLLVLAGLGMLIWGYLAGSRRFDELERRAAMDRHPAGLPRVTEQEKREALAVARRVRLYDWDERGEL